MVATLKNEEVSRMKIKEIEKLTGIKSTNIRFYEKEGLFVPQRTKNNYRSYTEEDVKTLERIKTLRLLGVSVEEIKKLTNGETSLESVLVNRLHQIEVDEKSILEQKKICEKMLDDKLRMEDVNEDILTGNREIWSDRLKKILREDIDPIFLMKGVLMLVGLASVVYLGLWVLTNPNYYQLIDLPTAIESDADALHIKLDIGVGIFLIVYGIIWGIIEGYKNLGLMWVASSGRNWAAPGMGALTNSYTLCGLGCAIIAIAARAWISGIPMLIMLCIGCILILTLIRGVFMWWRSEKLK